MIDHAQWLDSFVRASWQGALLVLAAWIAFRLLKNAPARFRSWIWPIVMTKFLLVAFVVWELPVLSPATTAGPVMAPTVVSAEFIEVSFVEPVAAPAVNIAQVLFALWAIGVGLVLARAIYEYLVLRKIASRATTAGHLVVRLCEAVADRRVTIKVHPDVPMPLVFGVFKPVVLLPSGTESELTDEQLRMVLAHEVAHIQRRDTATAVYVFLCQALFFFNPAVWIAKREWQMARESACDQYAMERTGADRRQYADMLIQISTGARRAPAFALSAVPAYKTLHRRIDEMNRTPNKTMAARLACLVVAAMIAAAALPVAFVQKQDSMGEAIFAELSKNKTKASQVAVLPAPVDSQQIVTSAESELVRIVLGLPRVTVPLQIQSMDVALSQVVSAASLQILVADVGQAEVVLARSLLDPLLSAKLVLSQGSLALMNPELTVQEAGVLKVTAVNAVMRLWHEPTRTVSFNKQKADQNEKYIALLEKYIALLEKHLKSLEGARDTKLGYVIEKHLKSLEGARDTKFGYVIEKHLKSLEGARDTKLGYVRLLDRLLDDSKLPPGVGQLPPDVSKLPPRVALGAAPYASSAVKAATVAYAKGVVLGMTVNVPKVKVQINPTAANIAFVKAVTSLAGGVVVGQSKASNGKVKVMVVEVGEKTFWIAAGRNATVNVSTKEGRIQIVEADGKKFWVALKPGTVKAEGTKLEIKVVEIDGKKIWIVTTPRKKERADKKGG